MEKEFSDAQIPQLGEGNQDAFRLLYREYFVSLCIFARNYGLAKEEAEDVVQEVFCQLCYARNLPGGIVPFRSYLYTSVRNRCLNVIRGSRRRRNYEQTFYDSMHCSNVLDQIVENEVYRRLEFMLSSLPAQCENIFRRSLDGDSSAKIAYDLNLSIETVKTQRKKAKRLLRSFLEKYRQNIILLFSFFRIPTFLLGGVLGEKDWHENHRPE